MCTSVFPRVNLRESSRLETAAKGTNFHRTRMEKISFCCVLNVVSYSIFFLKLQFKIIGPEKSQSAGAKSLCIFLKTISPRVKRQNLGGCIMQVQGAGCRVGKMQVCVCRGLFWPCTLPISNLQPAQ